MKRLAGTVAQLGMLLVFLSSMALPIDDPETAYNESDAPMTFASPAALNTVGANQLLEVSNSSTVFREQRVGRDNDATTHAMNSEHGIRRSNPQITLLSTLRC